MSELITTDTFENPEQIVALNNPATGLKGFIAIHTTKPGPALGATRMLPYFSEDDALKDAMRLAKTMTYKCAIAGLPHGGGKAVLIGNPKTDRTPELLKSYAEEVTKLKGKFFTGEDVGLFAEDVYYMQQFSPYFIGSKNKAGDSSPYAALGVFYCMQSALQSIYNTDSFKGKTVSIKGLGKTGAELARLILEAGGAVVASEVDIERANMVRVKHPEIQIVSSEKIHQVPADIFAPCALGDDVSLATINIMKPKIICGVANNQLQSGEVGDLFFNKGFLYIPDYLANAGGLIDVADELEPGGYSRERVLARILDLKKTCDLVLAESKQQNIPTHRVADLIAEKFLKKEHVQ